MRPPPTTTNTYTSAIYSLYFLGKNISQGILIDPPVIFPRGVGGVCYDLQGGL